MMTPPATASPAAADMQSARREALCAINHLIRHQAKTRRPMGREFAEAYRASFDRLAGPSRSLPET